MTNTPIPTPPRVTPTSTLGAGNPPTSTPFEHNKAALFGALAAAGITEVTVTFDGYGDSGQIEDIAVSTAEGSVPMPAGEIEILEAGWPQPEPRRTRVSLATAVEGLAYDTLAQTHCGWENNEGAYGNIVFNVAARSITLDYNERYLSSENFTHIL
jgi:hypothetical protein